MRLLPTAELDSSGIPRLRRILTVWDLAFYGLVSVTPSAPATVFGLAQLKSHGHAVDTILVAMVAMVLTAISYGSDGGFVSVCGFRLHLRGPVDCIWILGFVSGWAMLLDYVVSPLFCVMFGTLALMRSLPALPFPVWLRCSRAVSPTSTYAVSARQSRANQILLGFMFYRVAELCLSCDSKPYRTPRESVGCSQSSRSIIPRPSACAILRVQPRLPP